MCKLNHDAIIVSIIVPVYNVEEYLDDCIRSVLNQTVYNYEVIIINDGSTDNSGKIAEKYANKYDNIYCYTTENQGLSSARNTGLKYAKGKYILYLDSDDMIVPNTIEILLNIASKNDYELVIFGGNEVYFDTNKKIIKQLGIGSNDNISCKSGIDLFCYLKQTKSYYSGVWLQFTLKEVLINKKINFYNGILHEDHLYTFEVLMNVKKCCSINDKLYMYRIRDNSIMTSNKKYSERFKGFAITYLEMKKIIKKKHLKKEEQIIVDSHLNQIEWIATKYLCKISKEEEQEQKELIFEYKKELCHLKSKCLLFIKPLVYQIIKRSRNMRK